MDLPEYVIADDRQNRDFVIRLTAPRFVLELSQDFPVWIDAEPSPEMARAYAEEARLFFVEAMAEFRATQFQ
jgi:hypothetical protein